MRSDYITPEQAAALRPRLSPANALVLDICRETGLRVGDVVGLMRGDLERARERRGWLPVLEQKTGRDRCVRVRMETLGRALAQAGGTYVFPHRDDVTRHRTRGAVWGQLRRLTADWPERITPHSYRKLYAVELYARCGDLGAVQRDMGHESMGVTMLYALADAMTAKRLGEGNGGRAA